MREYQHHHDIQTTKKEPNRKAPKPIITPSKKLNHHQLKSIKRNLNSAFTPITEHDYSLNPSEKQLLQKISSISESVDVHQSAVEIGESSLISDHDLVLQRPEQLIGISSVSEAFVSDEDQFIDSLESYIMSSKQFISPSSATSVANTDLAQMTPSSSSSSSLITSEAAAAFVDSVTHDGATTDDIVQSMVNDLRESMCQVLNSTDLEPGYKKLFDALVKVVLIEELHGLQEEKDTMIVLLSFVLAAIVAGSLGFFLFSDAQSSYYGPPPT